MKPNISPLIGEPVSDANNILMPQLGETVTEGTISVWYKKVGEEVAVGENLFEIETDKTSMEIQATTSGTLTEILAQEGETVAVGTTVAVMGGGGAQTAPASAPAAPAAETGGAGTTVLMPQLGETVTEGTISVWHKKLGDDVNEGDNLFEIETDKTSMEIQATASGKLTDVLAKEGETVAVGATVAVIGGDGAQSAPAAPAAAPEAYEAPATPAPAAAQPAPVYEQPVNVQPASGMLDLYHAVKTPLLNYGPATDPSGIKITPVARRLIAEHGLNTGILAQTAQSAGKARIAKADVLAAIASGGTQAAATASPATSVARAPIAPGGQEVPLNKIRQTTATHLAAAWQSIPHVLQAVEVDFHNVSRVRNAHKGRFKQANGISLTYLAFIARAVCIAIGDFPNVNARYEGDKLIVYPHVNLGIAVDLAHQGLVVPVIKDANGMTVAGLAKAIAAIAEKARDKKLTPDDMSGGTYSLSNSGTFGTLITAPIVNPPEVAILSTDGVRKKPVVIESDQGDTIAIHPVGVLAQSFDHRAFDGAYSAAFLQRIQEVLETRDWARELE